MSRKKNIIRPFSIRPGNERDQLNLQIFNMLRTGAVLSVADISERTGISGDFAAGYFNACINNGLLKKADPDTGEAFELNEDYKKILGIGFNNGKSILTVMDLKGEIISREQLDAGISNKWRGKKKEAKELVKKIGEQTKLLGMEFRYAGVAVPEEIENSKKKIADILKEELSRLFKCDVLAAGDATAAGYGEKISGNRSNSKGILYVHSDVGNGVMIMDEMIVEPDNTGFVEGRAYLRPWEQFNIVNSAKKLVDRGIGSDIVNAVNGDVDKIDLGVVLKAAEGNDELARDIVRMSGLALGVRVAYLANVFDAGVVVLGGGTEINEGGFIEFVKESARKFLLKNIVESLEIVPGVLGGEASSVGAGSLCLRELFMNVEVAEV